MKATINKKAYDTENATELGYKYAGEFGSPDGYEERLFVTEAGQHFIYGVGGSDSEYAKPAIRPLTDKQAEKWKEDNAAG